MSPCERCDSLGYIYPIHSDGVYPCPLCNNALFELWRNGHLRAEHNSERCEDCDAVFRPRRRRPRERRDTPPPPTPRDFSEPTSESRQSEIF